MTDSPMLAGTDAALTIHQRWESEAAKLFPQNKARLFAALAAANITSVTVTFDGEGDSGQVEDIRAFHDDASVPLPGAYVERLELPYGEGEAETRREPVELLLETLVYDLLSEKHGGWENSDGAYGEFVFDVTAGTIALEFNERFTSSERHDHSW